MRFTDSNIDGALAEVDKLHASFTKLPQVILNAPPSTFFAPGVVGEFCKNFKVYEPMICDADSLEVIGLSFIVFPHEYLSIRSKLALWFTTICSSGGNVEVEPTKLND